MRRKFFIFFLAVLLLSFVSCPYQARATNELPYLSIHNNSGVPQNIKQYFYESNGQKETIVIVPQYKDISGNEPIKAITKGENYTKIIAAPYLKNKSLIHMEYVKEGLVFFDPQNIIFKDKQGKKTYLPYPAGITPGLATSPGEKGFLSVSDGEKVYFLVRNLAKLYLFDPQTKKMVFLAGLKEFKNDSLPFFSAVKLPGGYSLISLLESFGEPHLGSAGHCLLIKNNRLKGYWRNDSYAGGSVMPAWAEQNILVATQKDQMAVYSLPSFTGIKRITLNFKNPGVVRASKDYAVLRDNEQNVLHLLDLSTGEIQIPFETIFSGEEKALLDKKKKESVFAYPDFEDCLAINGDNFTFVRHEEDPLELILNGNRHGYSRYDYKTYRYDYNFKTRQYTKKEAVPGEYANITSRQKLVNDKGLDLSIIENGETLSVYANDKVISTFDYPRRFLGTYVKDNTCIVTYYLENILENGEKTGMFTSFTSALPSSYVPNEKKKIVSLPPKSYPFILQEAVATVPFNKSLYLIAKNKVFKVSNGKILKVIPVTNIVNYAVGKNTLYLYSKDKAWTINPQDKIQYLGPAGFGLTDPAKVLLDSKFIDPRSKIKTIEEKTKDKVLKAGVYHLGLVCSQDCYYVEAEFSAGKKGYYLLFEGSLLELPGTLKGKKYFIYETTEKIYSTSIWKLHKLIITTPKEEWEYWYKISVLSQKPHYLVQADTPKTKVVYNGVDMTDTLQPFIKNNVMYTVDEATVKMISPIHKIKTFPIFQKVKGKWVQTSNIFTNTDWEETISINLISTEPNSNIYSILRGGKIVKEKLNNTVLPYPGKKQKGLVYYGTKPLNISDYNYPNYLFFKNKMKEGTYSFNALPVRSFIKSVLPGAEITYDNATHTVTINCKGSY